LDNQKENKKSGAIDRASLLEEKAKQGMEFGGEASSDQKETVHIQKPKSHQTGIDRGRWSD
jgi:hypothetical protein